VTDHEYGGGWFFFGLVVGVLILSLVVLLTGSSRGQVERRWCAELFAAPQADTLAILRSHDFCEMPR